MTERDEGVPPGRELWLRHRSSPPGSAGPCPDLIELASYIDRRLGARAEEAIEVHLEACPRCLDHVLAFRSGPVAADVPPGVRAAARRVVSVPAPRSEPRVRARRWALAAGLAGAVLVAGWGGYRAGSRTAELEERVESAVRRELTFGLAPFVEADPANELPRRPRTREAS